MRETPYPDHEPRSNPPDHYNTDIKSKANEKKKPQRKAKTKKKKKLKEKQKSKQRKLRAAQANNTNGATHHSVLMRAIQYALGLVDLHR